MLSGIEAGRGIAALLVLLSHATTMIVDPYHPATRAFNGLFIFGRAGVDFFFVLSGFIITHVHGSDIGHPAAFNSFWRKRLLRIYPTYWIVFALYGIILAISPTRERTEQDLAHIIASAILLPDRYDYPILSVAWSLRHEVLFYAIFGVLILNRKVGLVIMVIWFSGIGVNMGSTTLLGKPLFDGIWNTLVFRVFNIQFLFGIIAAIGHRRFDMPRAWIVLTLSVAAFFVNGLTESFLPQVMHEWPPRHLIYALSSAMAILAVASLNRKNQILIPNTLMLLGSSSYSLYLLHTMIVMLLVEICKRARLFNFLPLESIYVSIVLTTAIVSILFSRQIEQNVIRAGNRVFMPERRLVGHRRQQSGLRPVDMLSGSTLHPPNSHIHSPRSAHQKLPRQ